jgi:hypothetical protein
MSDFFDSSGRRVQGAYLDWGELRAMVGADVEAEVMSKVQGGLEAVRVENAALRAEVADMRHGVEVFAKKMDSVLQYVGERLPE